MTTKQFLSAFGMETLRDLPELEALEDAGLLKRPTARTEPLSTDQDVDE